MLYNTTVLRALRPVLSPTGYRSLALRHALTILLFEACIMILLTAHALAQTAPIQAPLAKGIILIAHPAMEDPNFRHTVVLIIDHGTTGSLGLVLNRPTTIPLSETLPDVAALKGTTHRLFIGGPVASNRMTMLVRLKEPQPGVTFVSDEIYVGGSPDMLEGLISHPQPTEAFHVFAGVAGWAPDQLAFELQEGAWATLQADAADIFEKDSASLWQDSLKRLQAPMVISNGKNPLPHTRFGLDSPIRTPSKY